MRFSQIRLNTYSSSELLIKGSFWCEVGFGKRSTNSELKVIHWHGNPLLGKNTAVKLGLLRIGKRKEKKAVFSQYSGGMSAICAGTDL